MTEITQAELDELKPCPFCGGGAIRAKDLRGPGYENCKDDPDAWAYYVRCRCCAAQGPWSKSSAAAGDRLWNDRKQAEGVTVDRIEPTQGKRFLLPDIDTLDEPEFASRTSTAEYLRSIRGGEGATDRLMKERDEAEAGNG